ncbi:RDD family protein [Ralstonia solanacearum]|uniref:RDD family protein n=1 Tax=Ralstonia solanacearum TaxID=305 RepID=UPI00078BB2B5|nr:RDD family protein [Ralstonia solanacearum]AMP37388.1 hypothetical protein LBM2029_07475 [Ralstonia solanacearum]AXV86210.1 hypothetical protein CJO78_07760 [Ralstonia solanacearum]AXW05715.1 hypothetical protein CJO82_07530 [Ralstonia solanacearum]AXW23456.1 hypothetical protein CJO86_07535 [Ralstonia solanacearum]AXW80388.1 hypothetical protein CJO98_07765 [Ralstonia solanacearum]
MAEWWHQKGGSRVGPLNKDQLRASLVSGDIAPDTLVWTEGMARWTPLGEVDVLQGVCHAVPPPLPTPEVPAVLSDTLASPWRRFFARIFDVWWELLTVSFAISWVLSTSSSSFVAWTQDPVSSQLFTIACLPVAMLLDALVYRVFGNTPGKALLKVKVRSVRGETLTFGAYVRRNFGLWVKGLALGIPFVNLFTMAAQRSRIKRHEPASYDEGTDYRVLSRPIGAASYITFAVLFFGLLLVMSYLMALQRERDSQRIVAQVAPWFTWQNPITQTTGNISSRWTYKAQQNAQGQPLRTFSELSDKALVVMADEVVPGADIHAYVKAFQQGNLGRMVFEDGGTSSTYGGLPTWSLAGYMSENASTRVRVEIIQQGDRFWRIVSLQVRPYEYSQQAVDELRQTLRSSIAPVGSGT